MRGKRVRTADSSHWRTALFSGKGHPRTNGVQVALRPTGEYLSICVKTGALPATPENRKRIILPSATFDHVAALKGYEESSNSMLLSSWFEAAG
jgi:hypothetical protein